VTKGYKVEPPGIMTSPPLRSRSSPVGQKVRDAFHGGTLGQGDTAILSSLAWRLKYWNDGGQWLTAHPPFFLALFFLGGPRPQALLWPATIWPMSTAQGT